jgi:hypothetical protein
MKHVERLASICQRVPKDGHPTASPHDLLAGDSDQRGGRYAEPFGRTRLFAPTLTSRVVRFLQRKFVVMLAAYSTSNLARLLLVTRWVHLIGAMLFYSEETSKIAGGNYVRIFRLNAHV